MGTPCVGRRYLSKWGQILDDMLFVEQHEVDSLAKKVGEMTTCAARAEEDVCAFARACTELAITICFKIQYDCKKFGKPSERYSARSERNPEGSRDIDACRRPTVGDSVVLVQKRAWAPVGTVAEIQADDGEDCSVPFKILVKPDADGTGKEFFHWVKAEAVALATTPDAAASTPPHKARASIEDALESSPAQQGVLFHSSAGGGGGLTAALARVHQLRLQISKHTGAVAEALRSTGGSGTYAVRVCFRSASPAKGRVSPYSSCSCLCSWQVRTAGRSGARCLRQAVSLSDAFRCSRLLRPSATNDNLCGCLLRK